MTLLRKINDWLVHYPFTFALLVIGCASLALAGVALVQGSRIDNNSLRIDHIQQRDCFVDSFQVAQAKFVQALVGQDSARIAATLPDYQHATDALSRFNRGENTQCHPI